MNPSNDAAAEALAVLTGFDRQRGGWLCPVTISVAIEQGQNQAEAIDKVLAALRLLGISAQASNASDAWMPS
jgi:hypothetical protein